MKPGFFQGKKFPFTPKRRKKSLGSQCNNIIDTRHDLAAFRSKLANVSWLRSYNIVPFFKFFKTGKCFKTMLFPVSCVSQKPLPFQKHSLLLIQPNTHAKTLSERSEKCATVQVLTGTDSVARATYLQRALGALWRALYQV